MAGVINTLRERRLQRERMALDIGRELAVPNRMTVREPCKKYQAVFGEAARAGNKDFLFKRIAWRIESMAEGGFSEQARQRAEVLVRDADLRATAARTLPSESGGNRILLSPVS